MSNKYEFAFLRYTHDVMSGEFINIGVLLYAPEVPYLGCEINQRYRRLSQAFGGFNGRGYQHFIGHIKNSVRQLKHRIESELAIERPTNLQGCIQNILPAGEIVFTFHQAGDGTTESPDEALEQLFKRYVLKYETRPQPDSRTNEDIWNLFRPALDQRQVLQHLQPKVLTGKHNYTTEFKHVWKNGIYHVIEPISLDLVAKADIIEKGVNWQGRMNILAQGEDDFRLIALLGKPRNPGNESAYTDVRDIIEDAQCDKLLIDEEDAEQFAEQFQIEIAAAQKNN